MAPEIGLNSLEVFAEALMHAAETAHAALADDAAAIQSHLQALLDSMQFSTAVFYPADGGTLVRVEVEGRPIQAPEQISSNTHAFIRNLPIQVVSSSDAIFSMGHLRSMTIISAPSSLWAAVGLSGTIALFDSSVREFSKPEKQMVRLFAAQLSQSLTANRLERIAAAAAPAGTSAQNDAEAEVAKVVANLGRDLINPVTAMLGYIDLLKSEKLEERGKHYLQKLQEQTEKTHNVIAAFSAVPIIPLTPSLPATITVMPRVRGEEPEVANVIQLPAARVLIVQKNEATLAFKKAVLSPLTTDVIATFSGHEAINMLKNEDVNAVILDDEMDGEWPGRALYRWICEHKPELRDRVLLTVGSRPSPEIQDLIDESHLPHVSKPLQMVELFAGIQQILGAKPNRMLH
jgi:CheY-like chemotaxis protein